MKNLIHAILIFGFIISAIFYCERSNAQGVQSVRVSNVPNVVVSGTTTVSATAWTATDKNSGNISASTLATVERSAASSVTTGSVASSGANVRRLTVSGSAPSAGRKRLAFYTTTSGIVCYWGSSAVTTANGLQVPYHSEAAAATAAWTNAVHLENDSNDYYFVGASACTLKILEAY